MTGYQRRLTTRTTRQQRETRRAIRQAIKILNRVRRELPR